MERKKLLSLSFALAVAVAVAGASDRANAQTSVNTDVTVDTTWTVAQSPIILGKPIFVKNGATLSIQPGVVVRGQPRSGPVVIGSQVGTPGAIIVTQNGRINASASASNPIIMTTAAVDNDNDGVADDLDGNNFEDAWPGFDPNTLAPEVPGEALFLDDTPKTAPLAPLNKDGKSNVALWGGLVILGNAPTNNADKCLGVSDPNQPGVNLYGKCTVEGLTIPGFPAADATYGGLIPHDNSGVIRYVSVRHAGDEIGNGNELNGVSLGGVGDGTTYSYVEVYANFDDGNEWFGGTVHGDHLVVTFVGDDGVDVDEGYTGVNQFVWITMTWFNEDDGTPFGSASGDKAGEFDGDNYRPDNTALNDNVNLRINGDLSVVDTAPWPLSGPEFYNMTIIGSTPDPGQEFTPADPNQIASTNRGIQYRNGFAGTVYNTIVVNTGAETGIEIDTGIGDGAPGYDALDNVNNGLSALVSSTLDDGAGLAAAELTCVANGDAIAPALGGSANVVNSGLFNGLTNEDTTFDPEGNADGKLDASLKTTKIDPRPAFAISGVIGGVSPAGPGLDPAATYRGAFDRTVPALWTKDWTVLHKGGLLAD